MDGGPGHGADSDSANNLSGVGDHVSRRLKKWAEQWAEQWDEDQQHQEIPGQQGLWDDNNNNERL